MRALGARHQENHIMKKLFKSRPLVGRWERHGRELGGCRDGSQAKLCEGLIFVIAQMSLFILFESLLPIVKDQL